MTYVFMKSVTVYLYLFKVLWTRKIAIYVPIFYLDKKLLIESNLVVIKQMLYLDV